MTKKFLALSLLLSALLLPIRVSAQPYKKLVVFGDSLSDTGNLAALIAPDLLPLPRAYTNGGKRFSNGPLAVEVLADTLKLRVDPFAGRDELCYRLCTRCGRG